MVRGGGGGRNCECLLGHSFRIPGKKNVPEGVKGVSRVGHLYHLRSSVLDCLFPLWD